MYKIKDKGGKIINQGDFVSLGSVLTNQDGVGLFNGFFFDKDEDIYEVFFDESINHWSLKMGIKPNTYENVMLLNHALNLLHTQKTLIVKKPKK